MSGLLAQQHLSSADMVSSTHAFLPASKSLILSGRLLDCGPSIPITASYLTSDPESTSRALACEPFWNNACMEMSRTLWLPTETASPGSAQIWSPTSLRAVEPFLRSSRIVAATKDPVNSQMTSSQCSPTSLPSTTASERTITIKQRLYPTSDQKWALGMMFGAHRHFWNLTKATCDKVSQEALEAGIATLVAEHDDGMCHYRGCKEEVADATAPFDSKQHFYCSNHVACGKVRHPAKFLGRSRPFERMQQQCDDNGGRCLTNGCGEQVIKGTFRCKGHSQEHDDPEQPIPRSVYNFETVKSIINPPQYELQQDQQWYELVPCNTRTDAIKSYLQACSSTFTKLQLGDTKARMPGFLSRKSRRQLFKLRATAVQFKRRKPGKPKQSKKKSRHANARKKPPRSSQRFKLHLMPSGRKPSGASKDVERQYNALRRAFNKPIDLGIRGMLRLRKALSRGKPGDATIKKDENGRYYLEQPIKVPARETSPIWEQQAYRDAFIDPGGRTMLTVYSADGVAAKIGDDFYDMQWRRLRRSDSLQSAIQLAKNEGVNGRKERVRLKRMAKRAQALRTKVRNSVRDLHRKAMRFLCLNFQAIFIPPKFKVAVENVDSRISCKATRKVMTFAHCEFYDKLKQYAMARGVHVIDIGEAYTTKTCTLCGAQDDVGARKEIRCRVCHRKTDRDFAASRNEHMRVCVLG